MPVYEYRCDKCGSTTEHIEKFSDPPADLNCAKCEGGKVERLIGVPALQFKGSGWAADGYSSKAK